MSAIQRGDLLRSRLRSHRKKVDDARRLVDEALRWMFVPYVAWSGGKDSLVVLHLVARALPGVIANWSDDELEYDEQLTAIPAACAAFGARLQVTLGHARHADWFDPWRDEPSWRAPCPGAIRVDKRIEDWSVDEGFDGAFVGLRMVEAHHRAIYLRARGYLHRVQSGQFRCHPLAGWSVDDVWAYIAGHDLPYSPVYDRLTAIGVPRGEQRVGPLPLTPGWHLKAGWPAMYRRLTERYGHRWPA